jgi:hypothetical protein
MPCTCTTQDRMSFYVLERENTFRQFLQRMARGRDRDRDGTPTTTKFFRKATPPLSSYLTSQLILGLA